METMAKPWPALWTLVIGFFMILVDSTIVSVATPAIQRGLDADINAVVWVTSAYLLAYAVPLLITGRLGDKFGPKYVYLTGLVIFTLASLWCGFAGDINTLIIARVVQGLGASLMTPQTMAVITRIFPATSRGQAMALWGAVAGVATLVGPILGGVLTDGLGWEWIFFVNVPIGVVAFILALKFVPVLKTRDHKFDILGVVLSAIALFCIVFGIQEGETYNWGTITGIISVWGLIIVGIVFLGLFIAWQFLNKGEPLLPLKVFRDRNFSLANVGITVMGFVITGMVLPFMLFAQDVRSLSPTQAALLLVPMAVFTSALSPVVGRLVDRVHPRILTLFGFLTLSGSLFWESALMTPTVELWMLLFPLGLLGVANAFIWAPLSTTATRNLNPQLAGAGSGVYNTTRQVGAVIGSAAIAALMQSRLTALLPAAAGGGASAGETGALPDVAKAGFATAMSQAMLLPAIVALLGAVAVLFFAKPAARTWGPSSGAAAPASAGEGVAATATATARAAAPASAASGAAGTAAPASAAAGAAAPASAASGAAAPASAAAGAAAPVAASSPPPPATA
ncbi:DHA2 family efflux MFS transporter permease subunit [Subtercola endophyticus]|uniref:DHA2 family efflux MFS transporter permease subunit n=1 Tax=Subtercola endophyticus TaxID=2895559 RepID=UPI001E5DCF05|nr:DHA2 family efflux MFS transporter permease subunit [Subtercola endophyticus]UFS58915.1 DHA2 family efflux MFS transporter permease subunit [Subtercola endophyticus]